MPIVAAILGLAAIVWGIVYAQRGSVLVGCGLFVAVGYVFGHQFWNSQLGPLPITLDRLVLIGLLAALAIQWRMGRLQPCTITGCDLLLLVMLLVLIISATTSGHAENIVGTSSKWGRLLASFILPATLYLVVRHSGATAREWTWLLAGFVALGIYLGVTAVLEIAGVWSLVFPRYIADPGLGIHFGRARGPDLNAASLGLYLTASFWCGWTLLSHATRRWQQLAITFALPLFALGVFVTYTRSTWLGLAASGLVVLAFQIPRRLRVPALAAATLAGLLVAAVSWSHVVGLQREGTAAESEHSVDQRTSFAYVSWQMFRDHPVLGVGFGRFYDRKLPYLSDRSQPFELESIRPLHHHNTLLSILTETGIVGFSVCAAVLIAWWRQAWLLARNVDASGWKRAHGVLMLAIVTNYLCSAVFHDLTLVPSQQVMLFLFAALTVNVGSQRKGLQNAKCKMQIANCGRTIANWRVGSASIPIGAGHHPSHKSAIRNPQSAIRNSFVDLFGMKISCVTMPEAVNQLLDWCRQPHGDACRYVVTPNVDHAVLLQDHAELRAAYADASLVLADGAPIVFASRLLGRHLPERVAGSDLVPRLFDATREPLRVFLLGAAPGVAETAAAKIHRRWSGVQVVGTYCPPLGFERNSLENARILAAVAAAKPDLLVIGLGAPKQELWVHRHRHQLRAKVALCAGATIDFLAENRRRSPVWMRRAGLEWLHRVWCEPRRLAGRYARDAWVFPMLVWREWRRVTG
jgi:N-acetylglucosaminyldiphosphoundecaprenol N-acetyl-beta-D-mannosaminyltransferase